MYLCFLSDFMYGFFMKIVSLVPKYSENIFGSKSGHFGDSKIWLNQKIFFFILFFKYFAVFDDFFQVEITENGEMKENALFLLLHV